jgi:Holliday junction resolvase
MRYAKLYIERHQILKLHEYDDSFVGYNKDGILYLKNKDLQQKIEVYLINRES